ncbi:hypothetical protein TNCV_2576641 [Trichonephila clavipes]|nr:hypothetical protein TNCV_2576641 [Trichonephila clavipes]
MNHPCVCRAWRPVSLERRVLVIEGSQHIALASASGKREKGLSATVGSVKAVSKMRSGDLLVEISTTKQAEQLLALQMLANIPITVLPHANLNFLVVIYVVLSVRTFLILSGVSSASVLVILKPTCRGKPTCARCGAVGHDSGECNGPEKCVNCKGDHPSYSRSCSTWNLEKEIITVKIKNRLTYPEARLAVTNRTPIQGLSYAAVAKKVTTSSALQETFLKSCHTAKIRRYGCVRKDTESVAFYLPPNVVIRQQDLNDLVDQLPAPFVILGDFNGHSTLWGSVKTNHRGRQIEQVLSDHCLCLLNHEEPTHFHEPTRSFHTLDLAICSPSLLPILNFSVEKDLYNSDHFPVVLSHDYDAGGKPSHLGILIVVQNGPFSHSWL